MKKSNGVSEFEKMEIFADVLRDKIDGMVVGLDGLVWFGCDAAVYGGDGSCHVNLYLFSVFQCPKGGNNYAGEESHFIYTSIDDVDFKELEYEIERLRKLSLKHNEDIT